MTLLVLAPIASAAHASLVRSPALGPHGTLIAVSGIGFAPNEAVDVYFDRADLALGVVGADGQFPPLKVAVPDAARLGTHWLSAVGRASHASVQVPFDVTPSVWSSWSQFGGDGGHSGYQPDETSLTAESVGDLGEVWTAGVGYADYSVVVGRVLVVENFNPAASPATLAASDAWTGAPKWSVDLPSSGGPIAAWHDLVIQGAGDRLIAYDLGSGVQRWVRHVGPYSNAPWRGFTVAGDVAYLIGNGDGGPRPAVLTAFDLSTLRTRWTTPLSDNPSTYARDVVVTGGVAAVSVDRGLVGVDIANGDVRWFKPWVTGWTESMAAMDGILYVPAMEQGAFLALEADTGRVVWRSTLARGMWISGLATDRTRVYVPYGPFEDPAPVGLWAYDVGSGRVLWDRSSTERFGAPAVANGLVYAVTNHALTIFDAGSGKIVRTIALAADFGQQPTVANGTVYVTTADGVVALRTPGASKPPAAGLTPDRSLVPGATDQVTPITTGWTSSPNLDPSLGAAVTSSAQLDGVLYLGTMATAGGSAAVLKTSDGSTFERAVRFPDASSVRLTVFGDRVYVATQGTRGASLYASSDGRMFTLVPDIDTTAIHAITPMVWRDGLMLVADTDTGPQIWTSADGSTFTRAVRSQAAAPGSTFAVDPTGAGAVLYGGALYLGTRSPQGGEIWRTTDGTTLERVGTDGLGRAANSALVPQLVFGGRLYVVAEGSGGFEVFRSSDGTDFERTAAAGFRAGIDRNLTGRLAGIDGRLVLVGGSRDPVAGAPPIEVARSFGLRVYVSEDGAFWDRVATSIFADQHDWTGTLLGVDGALYLAGTNHREGDAVWRSADGTTWELSFREPTATVTSLGPVLVLHDGHLLAFYGDSVRGISPWRSDAVVTSAGVTTATPWWEWVILGLMLVVVVSLGVLSAQAYREGRRGRHLPPRHAHPA